MAFWFKAWNKIKANSYSVADISEPVQAKPDTMKLDVCTC